MQNTKTVLNIKSTGARAQAVSMAEFGDLELTAESCNERDGKGTDQLAEVALGRYALEDGSQQYLIFELELSQEM